MSCNLYISDFTSFELCAHLMVCCNVCFQRVARMAIKWLPRFIRPDRGAFDPDFRIIPHGGVLCGLVIELQGALCDLFV